MIFKDSSFLQEIDELMKQIYAAHAAAQSAFSLPDLAAAMKQIQTQYDDIAAKNLQVEQSHVSTAVKCFIFEFHSC